MASENTRNRPLYLLHSTTKDAWEKIKQSGYINPSSFSYYDQFPGVFVTLVTESTLEDEFDNLFYQEDNQSNSVFLVLGVQLLNQQNYHFNLNDNNGDITDDTYYPWNMKNAYEDLPKAIDFFKNTPGERYFGNELVFHDPIPVSFVAHVMEGDKPTYLFEQVYAKDSQGNVLEPNLSLLPYYASAIIRNDIGVMTNSYLSQLPRGMRSRRILEATLSVVSPEYLQEYCCCQQEK